jgi:ATP-dependent Lon protease
VAAYDDIERARLLLDEFSKNDNEFNKLPNLSEALTMLSDLNGEDEQIKKIAANLIRTHKRHLIQRINYALANPSEFTYQQWEYFYKATDDFLGTEPDNNEDLTKLQEEIRKQKYLARINKMPENERLSSLLAQLISLSEEKKKKLVEQLESKENNDG